MRKLTIPLVMAALVCVGCVTFKDTAGKLLVTTALTVDSAMQGWAQWVVAGQATPEQEGRVKQAYLKYQASMAIAQSSYQIMVTTDDRTEWQKASDMLTSSRGALLALIASFTPTVTTNAP